MGRRLNVAETTAKTVKGTIDSILSELVSDYGRAKKSLDDAKAECDGLNKQLKDVMHENDITEFSADGYKVKYIVAERETMNEERLLELMTTKYKELSDTFELVKMRPYVDTDAIEKETYNGNIPQDLLADMGKCIETKEVVTLKLSKEKK